MFEEIKRTSQFAPASYISEVTAIASQYQADEIKKLQNRSNIIGSTKRSSMKNISELLTASEADEESSIGYW